MSSNRILATMLGVAAILAAFWLLALAPKRDQAAKLGTQVESLQQEVDQLNATVAAADEARRDFADDYAQLVTLGKAVPADDDTASLLVQLNKVAGRNGLEFRDIELQDTGASAGVPAPTTTAPPAPTTTTTDPAAGAVPAASPVPATEAAAALMPLGATIGPAGLAVMPYKLTFAGSFFDVSKFVAGVDSLVKTETGRVTVDGRLMTIDGFSLTSDPRTGFPALTASVSVTTYVTPPGQGVTVGATPAAPAPVGATATPTSTTTPAP